MPLLESTAIRKFAATLDCDPVVGLVGVGGVPDFGVEFFRFHGPCLLMRNIQRRGVLMRWQRQGGK